jgi:SAM-dependent methyltransferase
MKAIFEHDMEEWGHPSQATPTQRLLWNKMRVIWNRFCEEIPEPSLDIGAGVKKGRTVSLDPFPRGVVDVRAVAELLPFKDNIFKSIVLESVLKHAIDPETALSEARRVAKNKSYLFFSSPVNAQDKHRHSFTSIEILELLDRSGYRVVKRRGIGFSLNKLDKLLRRLNVDLYLTLRVPLRFCRTLFLVCASKI